MKILPEFDVEKNFLVLASEVTDLLKVQASSYQEIDNYLKAINIEFEQNMLMESLGLLFLIGCISLEEGKLRMKKI